MASWTWSMPVRRVCVASGALARQVQEGERHDLGVDAAPVALDRPLDRELRADRLVLRRDACQADRLLQDRAPAVARELADLASAVAGEHRHGRSIHGRRDRRRQPLLRERTLDVVPLELDADEAARRAALRLLLLKREAPDEVGCL